MVLSSALSYPPRLVPSTPAPPFPVDRLMVLQIFRKQHLFRGADNEHQLFKIMCILCTEGFDAYEVPYERDVEDLLGSCVPVPSLIPFLSSSMLFLTRYDTVCYDNNQPPEHHAGTRPAPGRASSPPTRCTSPRPTPSPDALAHALALVDRLS
ncbi:hypothetical protein K438DRAFT_134185 [Mycena galopus ATCC 62051]|nr:hypothetical protein K438DRAFT_134185 [Mycena galopus ATCC 62051]